jgi:8-oxo-dGTP pyrophosphatase MutT (NUDIX family)
MIRPRLASTVVLARPDESGRFQILLTRRPPAMRFLGGYYVFPGGTVHQDDYTAQTLARCRGLSGQDARRILGGDYQPEQALGHWVAVVRELFEEVGVLLCAAQAGTEISSPELERQRQAVAQRRLDFGGFLESENLYCDLSKIVYFDHWVTPEIYSMRFDTRFYLAVMPANQTALAASEEVTESLWISPNGALSRTQRSDFPILPPTTTVLNNLGRFPTWRALQKHFDLR